MTGGFPIVPLGEVLRPVSRPESADPGITYRILGAHWYAKGLYIKHIKRGSEIQADKVYRVEHGDFVYNRLFAWKGSFAIATEENHGCYVSNEFPVFTINRDRAEGKYLWRYFSRASAWDEALSLSSGGTPTSRNRLKEEKLLAMKIPLPSLHEQRRIVARTEELAAKIDEVRGLRSQTSSLADLMWSSILCSGFVPEPNARPNGPEPARHLLEKQAKKFESTRGGSQNNAHPWAPSIYSKGLYPIPSEWVWTDLGSILTHLIDCVNDTPNFAEETTGLYGLKSTNIRPYKLDLSERWFMTPEDFAHWNRRERPRPRDIILTREAPMGNACIFPDGVEACLTQRLMLLRTDPEFVECRYVLHFLNSQHFAKQIFEVCRGLTTPHIRVKDAPRFLIPLAPRQEQRRIVANFDQQQARIEALKGLQAETGTELDALLPSILDTAFKGEL
jgi:type I restriction enzyme S subunit